MPSTWAATASNQLVTIAAWNNFQPSTPISGTSTKIVTKAMICAVVNGNSNFCYNQPMSSLPSNQCPTKQNLIDTQ